MNIEKIFHEFRAYLGKNQERLAPLQLVARLEGILTLEFAATVAQMTGGKDFALTNAGNRAERKYDVVVIEGTNPKESVITHLLQSKYLRNRHRIFKGDATDETRPALQDLAEQLKPPTKKTQYGYDLRLSSRANSAYGLVFGSHVREAQQNDRPEGFFRRCLGVARECGLRSFDSPKPGWFTAYEDVRVSVLGTEFRVTLRTGLWRRSG
jgi:hypothetical protein